MIGRQKALMTVDMFGCQLNLTKKVTPSNGDLIGTTIKRMARQVELMLPCSHFEFLRIKVRAGAILQNKIILFVSHIFAKQLKLKTAVSILP